MIPPLRELVNAFEFESVAQSKLDAVAYEEIAGGDHAAFDRMTFRPRLMVNTTKLDLTLDLFGQSLFAPILVGPTSEQKRFHPDGELAMVRGASAAKAADSDIEPIEISGRQDRERGQRLRRGIRSFRSPT